MPNKPIAIRLPEAEKAIWQAAAQKDGIDALGTWLKQIARNRIRMQGEGKE